MFDNAATVAWYIVVYICPSLSTNWLCLTINTTVIFERLVLNYCLKQQNVCASNSLFVVPSFIFICLFQVFADVMRSTVHGTSECWRRGLQRISSLS